MVIKKPRLNVLQKNCLKAGLLAVVITAGVSLAKPANAAYSDEVQKINDMVDTLAGMTSGMTDVAVLPMGLGAAMQTFRHIVLRNV